MARLQLIGVIPPMLGPCTLYSVVLVPVALVMKSACMCERDTGRLTETQTQTDRDKEAYRQAKRRRGLKAIHQNNLGSLTT